MEGSYKGVTVMFSDAPSQGGGLKSYPELSVGRYIFISWQGNTKNPATRFYVVLNKIETQTGCGLKRWTCMYIQERDLMKMIPPILVKGEVHPQSIESSMHAE